MNQQLIDYIRAQLTNGYTLGAVKAYLVNQGYLSADVEQAVTDMETQNEEYLISYIRQQLERGMTEETVKEQLLKLGYPLVDINHALTTFGLHKSSNKKLVYIYALVVLVLFGSGLFLFFSSFSGQEALGLKTELASPTTISAGKSIQFTMTFLSDFDGTATYVVEDYDTGELVTFDSETISASQDESRSGSVDIPGETASGKYLLTIRAGEGERLAESNLLFDVEEKKLKREGEDREDTGAKEEITPEPIGEEDETPIIEDETGEINSTEEVGQTTPEYPELPARNQTDLEELSANVTELAGTNVNQAVKVCKQTPDSLMKDACFAQIANSLNNPLLCDEILGVAEKDNCYWNHVLKNKDYTVCQKISNKGLKDSCVSLEAQTPDRGDISLLDVVM